MSDADTLPPVEAIDDEIAVADPRATIEPVEVTPPQEPGNKPLRRRAFRILAVAVVIGLIVWAISHFLFAVPEEETDDAYVAGDVVSITARDAGQVIAIYADNTQTVKAGDPLIDLDPVTAEVNLASAAADLAKAVRATRADFTQVGSASASVAEAEAELQQARNDFGRRQGAAAEGAVSGEELAHARDAVVVATASLQAARAREAEARSAVSGTDVSTNPAVLAATAAYRRAAITRSHMHVTAPVAGLVAQRTVQIGQQVPAGAALMAVVPLGRAWIDANFRETQLKDLRVGQRATIVTDAYGADVVFHGRVQGVGAGSGNAFALLPAQNASGNWIKIVQRVPVRIALDPGELQRTPLRIGLSVKVTVDTANTDGQLLGRPATKAYGQKAADGADPAVEARIRQIIAANR